MARASASGVSRSTSEGAFAKLRLRLRKVAFGTIKRRLKGSWIYFEQDLALADERTLCVVLLDDVACDLGANLCVDVTVQGRHPFAIHGDVARFYRGHFDLRYWHRCCCLTLVAPEAQIPRASTK